MGLAYCYDEMVRELCGISYEDSLTTGYTNYSTATSEEISKPESQSHVHVRH